MVAESKAIREALPQGTVTKAQVVKHWERIRISMRLPFQRYGAFALEKDNAQAVAYVCEAIFLAEWRLAEVGVATCEDLPDGIQTAYSIHCDRFTEYLRDHPNEAFPTHAETWSSFLIRLFMAYYSNDNNMLRADTLAEYVERTALEYGSQLSSWIDDGHRQTHFDSLELRINDLRRRRKLLKEYAPEIHTVLRSLPSLAADEIYRVVKPGTDVIWTYHVNRILERLKHAFGEYAYYEPVVTKRNHVAPLVGAILVWSLGEVADATRATLEAVGPLIHAPIPESDPWFCLFRYSARGKDLTWLKDCESKWMPV